jgi:ribosome-associated translation inhibitor RaiA
MGRLDGEATIEVSTQGEIAESDRAYAIEKIEALARRVREPVLGADVRLVRERDPANEKPYVSELVCNVQGRPIRARADAAHCREATDIAVEHLHRRIDRAQSRLHRISERRETGAATATEWRHGDLPTSRPRYFPRPVDEREVVRRKTFALDPITLDEAAFDLEQLAHDFYLFTELKTGADCVLSHDERGQLLLQCAGESAPDVARAASPISVQQMPVTVSTIEEAEARLNLTDEPFAFFRSAETGRGEVLYRRRDGHYGLIVGA